MNITEIKNDNNDLHIKVTVPAAVLNSEVKKEMNRIAKTVKIDGFRAGKAPESFLQKKYGASVRSDAVKNTIIKAINDVRNDRNLRIFTDPDVTDIKNKEGSDLEFTLEYQLLPEISMPDFKKITIKKPTLKLEDKDLKKFLDEMAEKSKDYTKESKVKSKNGDQVTIDAIGYVDGKEFAGGKLEGYKLVLGSKVFIDGFEDQLIGVKAGEDVSVKVTFPEGYPAKELASQPAEFKVKVLAVHTGVKAKINDEFAQKVGATDLEDLKKQLTDNVSQVYEEHIKTSMKMELFDKLEKELTFDVPQLLIDKELEVLEKQVAQTPSEDDDLKDKSEAEKKAYFIKLASRRIKIGLMLAEYVKLHNVQIEKSDINKAIIKQARSFPGQEEEIVNFYNKNPRVLESLRGNILEEKVVQILFEKEVTIKEKFYNSEDLEEMLEQTEEEHLVEHVHGPHCNHDHD